MIIVKDITWIDEESREADVLLSDKEYFVECFCSDCSLSVGDVFFDMIHGFNVTRIYRSFEKKSEVVRKNGIYHLKGQLIDKKNLTLRIGEFSFDLSEGNVPNDIKENEFVEVNLSRLDIY